MCIRDRALGWGAVGLVRSAPPTSAPPPLAAGTRRPHVVLIVLDTLRADHVGVYGHPGGLTPELDAVARDGAVFEEAFAPAPWTVPSHASLFTGLFPRSHGASTVHHRWLDGEFETLAEAFAEAGYRTAGFSANPYLEESNLHQGFATWTSLGRSARGLRIRPLLELVGWPAALADHGAAEAVDAVERFLADRSEPGAPRLLFVNLLEPHWRYLPPLPERGAFLPEGTGLVAASLLASRVYGPLLMAGEPVKGPVEAVVRAHYAAAVRYQDRQLGRVFASLERHLDARHTLLVVTSDHGENLGEAGRWDHVFALNDHLLRVPLVVRFPPVFGAGERVEGLCQLVDVPVTVAELVEGVELPGAVAGRSLAPGRFEPREWIFAEGDPYYGHLERMAAWTGLQRDVGELARPLQAVRSRDHKLVLRSGREPRLFAPADDPDEERDLSGEGAEVAAELLRAHAAWLDEQPAYRPPDRAVGEPLDPAALGGLEDLGYASSGDR